MAFYLVLTMFSFPFKIYRCAPRGTEPHVALLVQPYYFVIVSNKLFGTAANPLAYVYLHLFFLQPVRT